MIFVAAAMRVVYDDEDNDCLLQKRHDLDGLRAVHKGSPLKWLLLEGVLFTGLERNLLPGFGRFRLKKQNPNVQNPRKKQEELVLYNAMPNWYAEL